jgi:hypothetical protein
MIRRRQVVDPLLSLPVATWLVTRDRVGAVSESRLLPPGTALRAVLVAARDARIAAGWAVTDIGRACSVVFCDRDGVRVEIGIQRVDPAGPAPRGHSDHVPR